MAVKRTVPQPRTRDSVFYELTRSICPECRKLIDAEIHLKDGRVLIGKRCSVHGHFEALLSTDAEGYVNSLRFNKPAPSPWSSLPR
ncbi:MAG: hypothetical protein HY683_04170 [Chloroflexi bacterium]|nr:hypothetical protein [Chloroflexota bacterium]